MTTIKLFALGICVLVITWASLIFISKKEPKASVNSVELVQTEVVVNKSPLNKSDANVKQPPQTNVVRTLDTNRFAAIAAYYDKEADRIRQEARQKYEKEMKDRLKSTFKLAEGFKSISEVTNAGSATPEATAETLVWAHQNADLTTLADGLFMDADAEKFVESFLAAQPPEIRSQFP